MGKWHPLLALAVALFIPGCAQSTQSLAPEPALSNAQTLKSTNKAVVVLSGVVKFQAMWTTYPSLKTFWLPKSGNSTPNFLDGLTVDGFGDPAKPIIKEIKAGHYTLQTFSFAASNLKYTNTAGMRGLPITSFTVKPGDVLYLGHLVVLPEKSILVKAKMKQKIKIHDHTNAARAHLRKKSPVLAERMKTNLLKFSPLFTAVQG